MKTKAEFIAAIGLLRRYGIKCGLVVVLVVIAAILVMRNVYGIAHRTDMAFALVCYFGVQFVVPASAAGMLWRLKSLTRKLDLSCPTCRKRLAEAGRDLRKIAAENKCPFCGSPVYLA